MTTFKRCPACSEWKEAAAGFSVNRTRKDGRQSQCKACDAARYLKNIERVKVTNHVWYLKNKAHVRAKERERAAMKRLGGEHRG